jgi:hypothetical protein
LSFPVPFVPFQIQPFVNLKFHVLAPVGGIAIIQYFGLQIHPVRVQIEHKTGKAIMAYFFQENDAVHGDDNKDKKAISDTAHDKKSGPAERTSSESARSDPSAEDALWASAPPKRSSSSQNLTAAGLRPLTRVNSSNSMTKGDAAAGHATPRVKHSRSSLSLKEQVEKSQAEEMRSRASHNRTFVYIEVESSTFVMSYKVRLGEQETSRPMTQRADEKLSTITACRESGPRISPTCTTFASRRRASSFTTRRGGFKTSPTSLRAKCSRPPGARCVCCSRRIACAR